GTAYEASAQLAHLRLAIEVAGIGISADRLPRSRRVTANGVRVHFLDWAGRGTPIVFLHGGLLTAHTWDLVCVALSSRHRCLALDMRGHGESEWSARADYRVETLAADVADFVRRVVRGPFALVGHSLGGLAAMAYAWTAPADLRALVIVDVGVDYRRGDGVARMREFSRRSLDGETIDDLVRRARRFAPRRDPRLLRRSLLHNLRSRPDGGLEWKYDPALRARAVEVVDAGMKALRRNAARIDCPTLVVHGAESDLATAEQTRDLAALVSRGSWTQIRGTGHTIQGENPGALAAAMDRFLSGTLAAPDEGRERSRERVRRSARRAAGR